MANDIKSRYAARFANIAENSEFLCSFVPAELFFPLPHPVTLKVTEVVKIHSYQATEIVVNSILQQILVREFLAVIV